MVGIMGGGAAASCGDSGGESPESSPMRQRRSGIGVLASVAVPGGGLKKGWGGLTLVSEERSGELGRRGALTTSSQELPRRNFLD